eukprot:GFKZ01014744.1.p1 GENE.GFKZ01014744.1~~GFKZ01014744.1.p1  ORF type:complete len:412 (-),score=61.71 GFKZ01014744.1:360-1595(-)
MSLSRRGTATPNPTLTSLPHDIHLHILHFMHPTQLALYSQLCTLTHVPTQDPSLWANIARRHLGISPPAPATPASVSALAESLVSRWWLMTGVIVPGVPVHFRKGFAQIYSRGGEEVLLDERGDSAYVWGGKQKEGAIPATMPGMELDFYLDVAGPFPMEGIKVKVLHAAREEEAGGEMHNDDLPLTPKSPVVAKVRIRVNEEDDKEVCLEPSDSFETFEFVVDADALRTKPRMNRLFIEYDRHSTASYWMREVMIVPCVLPMPRLDERKLLFKDALEVGGATEKEVGNSDGTNEVHGWEHEMRVAEERRDVGQTDASVRMQRSTSPRGEEGSPRASRVRPEAESPPRRVANSLELDISRMHLSEPTMGKGKMPKCKRVGKTPKHMYHHNHYRSPRGNSRGGPVSPRAKGR